MLFIDLVLQDHTSGEIQAIKRTYSVKEGLGKISIQLVYGGIPKGL